MAPRGPAVSLAEPGAVQLGRRGFLRVVSAAAAALTAAVLAIPSLIAFLGPAFRKPTRRGWLKVAQADLLDIGTPVKVDFAEDVSDAWVQTRALRTVWLYTEDGENFTAYNGTCTHLACSYGFDRERGIFHCPCHHGLFDLKTGAVLGGPPPRTLDTLEVRVVEGELQVLYKDFRAGIPQKIEA
jgi:menaquinol-cytochrome c reductase iron-sulfur subunit